jgi:small subunit ribosomal protein S19
MARSAWKGPYVAVSLLQDVIALAQKHPEWWSRGRFMGVKAPAQINTHSRTSTILPDFLRCKFGVYNGKEFVALEVSEGMVGHRFGEFSPSRKVCVCVGGRARSLP